MKEIRIKSKKYGDKTTIVDDVMYDDLVINYRWFVSKDSTREYYYITGYHLTNSYKRLRMNRVVLGATDPKIFVDHIDRNPLNNQKLNLRFATQSQNQRNRGKHKVNSVGYKGVRRGTHGGYQILIKIHRRVICGGTYTSPEEAAKHWNVLARHYHGEFAYQNPV